MQDFRAQYLDQVEFLRASAEAYDSGREAEAKRLALGIRIMVHDTRRSKSLLNHLGLKRRMPFRDTALAETPPGVITVDAGLCVFRFKLDTPGVIEFHPPLDDLSDDRRHPSTCFDDWWLTAVLDDAAGNSFTRRDLVLSVADQDGGAHIDAQLNPAYAALTRGNSLGFGQGPGGEPNSASLSISFAGASRAPSDDPDDRGLANSIALASVRQIGHELLSSLGAEVVDNGADLSLRTPICPIPFSEQPRIARNDPCPCGSGQSFKSCFGRREGRRPANLPMVG
jgi:hypothetical protein